MSHHALLPSVYARRGIVLVPRQEINTGRGHANAWGDIAGIDFREHPDKWIRSVRRQGGFISINHPVSGDCAWRWSFTEPVSHAELLHSCNVASPESAETWAWWAAAHPRTAFAGGDFHYHGDSARVGRPVTWIGAKEGQGEIGGVASLRRSTQ